MTDEKFVVGEKYKRRKIHEILGGGNHVACLPQIGERIYCGCFNAYENPNAPEIIDIGKSDAIEKAAKEAVGQKFPVFLKEKRNERVWRYKGLFSAERYDTDAAAIMARNAERELAGVLRLKKVEGAG